MKMRFYFFNLLFGLFSLFLVTQSLAAQRYASVEEMIANQKTIRVLIDIAPGYGNQAASLNLMNRLRQMNFQGTFEVIYPDDSTNHNDDFNIKDKVINLFNLPKDIPPVYYYEDSNKRKIIFIAESEYIKQFNNHLISPIQLSVTGAHDSDTDDMCMKDETCRKYGENFADYTNSAVFVEFQPWFSFPTDSISTHNETQHQINPEGKYLIFPVANLIDAKKYLEEDINGQSLLAKKPALKTLIDGIQSHQFNVLPIYGFPFRKMYNEPNDDQYARYVFPQNIIQVITAARYAQLNGPIELRQPLVIPVFYDYREEMREIKALMSQTNWKEFEKQGGAEMRAAIKSLGLADANVFSIADIADTDVSKKMAALKPGQILLLSMGSLPKVVFDGIYTYTDTNVWPQIREGQSSLNTLVLTGKPHFRCDSEIHDGNESRWELGFDYIQDAVLKDQLQKFYADKGFCSLWVWKTNPSLYRTLGQLIIDANNPISSFSLSFQALKVDTTKPENDRIYRGLEEALKTMNAGASARKN